MRAIDTHHLGRRRWICCWQVGDVLVDPGPTLSLDTVIDALDGWQPRAILLTHIHFDHASGTGTLMRRFPELEVYVHERGAPHMVDPERLWASASRLYGEENMLALWGPFEPVPEERMHVLSGGETLTIGADTFEVAYTPGHAKHHVSYLHDGTAFVGDVGGVRIDAGLPVIPPTPPPDIDLEAWHESIELLRQWQPERLAITHFGMVEDPAAQFDELEARLDQWARTARLEDRDGWIAEVEAELRAATTPETFDSFIAAVPVDQSYAGLRRYWDKRAGGGPA
jgi:glyoxylase-like metal-dependent hydrolase (beta-lactamase superfamily II)